MSDERLAFALVPTDLGTWLVAERRGALAFVGLGGEADRPALDAHASSEELGRADAKELESARQLADWAAGRRADFELELDVRGSEFDRRVWRELLAIPFGATATYGEVARRLGEPGAARAVGAAAGRNPVPVVVPCHRVVAAGELGGFSARGGRVTKRALLEHERRHAEVGQGVLPFGD